MYEDYELEFYNRDSNLVFYNIPKCSMTSILRALKFERVPVTNIPDDAPTFCVLRDPFERFASTFFQIQSHYRCEYNYHDGKLRMNDGFLKEVFNSSEDLRQQFYNYINSIYQCGYWENHNISQINYISGKVPHHRLREFKKVKHFLKFENLNEEFKNKILDINLPHLNKKAKDNSYKNLIEEFKNDIKNLYSEDVDLYNQKFGNE